MTANKNPPKLWCLCALLDITGSLWYLDGRTCQNSWLVEWGRQCVSTKPHLYSVDLEVWSKFAQCAGIKRIASSKFARDFDCDWQYFPVPLLWHALYFRKLSLTQIDTKVPVLVVMECKHVSLIHAYKLIFLLYTLRSTEYKMSMCTTWHSRIWYLDSHGWLNGALQCVSMKPHQDVYVYYMTQQNMIPWWGMPIFSWMAEWGSIIVCLN